MHRALAVVLAAGMLGALLTLSYAQDVAASEEDMTPIKRIFISGHSLTNQPVPDYLAAIAASAGIDLEWNRQYLEGSSIRQRSRGSGEREWSGYAQGLDRHNKPADVLAAFSNPARRYDALLMTEQHSLLGSLVWNETVRYLRDYQDRFAAHNPDGTTFFFEPWLSLDNKDDPRRWIGYERAAAPVWRCIVHQMNVTLAAEGRKDRIVSVPAATALARLLELATQPGGLAGISRANVRATVDSLIIDEVHLTPLGNYYIALVSFASIFGRSPEGLWHPADVTVEQAAALQKVARNFASQRQPEPMPLSECASYVRKSFMWRYMGYASSTHWQKERGTLGSLYLRARLAVQWLRLFSSEGPGNPFSEAAYRRR